MEAMWTRFLPHMERVREVVKSGELGEIVSVTADFGIRAPRDPEHRAFNPLLGGGALLDLGIYPISFAWMVLGAPSLVTAVSDAAETGVDAQTSMIFQYPSGAHAVLTTNNYAATATTASINGIAARLEIGRPFYRPSGFRVLRPDDTEIDSFRMEYVGVGLRYQAAEVGRCLRAGLTESPVMPLDETLAIMETLDAIRAQIGLTYP
jgi:predicted dehydrogenase